MYVKVVNDLCQQTLNSFSGMSHFQKSTQVLSLNVFREMPRGGTRFSSSMNVMSARIPEEDANHVCNMCVFSPVNKINPEIDA